MAAELPFSVQWAHSDHKFLDFRMTTAFGGYQACPHRWLHRHIPPAPHHTRHV